MCELVQVVHTSTPAVPYKIHTIRFNYHHNEAQECIASNPTGRTDRV